MTSRERTLTALRGGTPDRVPIWAWGVHPWLGPVDPSVQPVVDAYLERGDTIHWWSPGAGTFLTASDQVSATAQTRPSELPEFDEHVVVYETPAGELTQINYASREGKPGYCKKHLLQTPEDAQKLLSIPYVPPRPDCSTFFSLQDELGDAGVLMVAVPSDPMYALNNLTGSETFAIWSIEERGLIRELVGEFARRIVDWVEWALSQGVGPLFGYVGPELCIPPLQSPADFEELVVGPNRQVNDIIRAGGGIAFVHCHGRMDPVLEGFVRMHCDALHPIEPPPVGDVTMRQAKARVGRDLCIVGNIQAHDVDIMAPRRFRDLVRQAVEEGMRGGGFILSPTATPFDWPTMTDRARENWLAMLEVGLQVGRYSG